MVEKRVFNKFTESQERTALSILLGLRMKFAKEDTTYTSKELHEMISYLLKQTKRVKINQIDLEYAFNPPKKIDEVVDKAIKRSKIKRTNWEVVLNGNSLTKEILLLKKQGKEVNEAFDLLKKDKRILQLLKDNEYEAQDILNKLEISVHARYAENNSANRIMENERIN